MEQSLSAAVEKTVEIYKNQTSGTKIYFLEFSPQEQEDGLAVNGHPTESTNCKAAKKLTDSILKIIF